MGASTSWIAALLLAAFNLPATEPQSDHKVGPRSAKYVPGSLSDKTRIEAHQGLFIGDGMVVYLLLRDDTTNEIWLSYSAFLDSKKKHHSQFGIGPLQSAKYYVPRRSREEVELIDLIRLSYENSFGQFIYREMVHTTESSEKTRENRKRFLATWILQSVVQNRATRPK